MQYKKPDGVTEKKNPNIEFIKYLQQWVIT